MNYDKPILRRYKDVYIEIRGDVAKCYKSPLNQKYARLQWIKQDGQGNKYVTYNKKKIIIS